MKRFLLLLSLVTLVVAIPVSDVLAGDKEVICHNGRNINVASGSVPSHEAHGDQACPCGDVVDDGGFGACVGACTGNRGALNTCLAVCEATHLSCPVV